MSGTSPLLGSFTITLVGGAAPVHRGMMLITMVLDTVTPPALAEAVMVAAPLAIPVTRPALFTTARAVLEDDHMVCTAKALPFSSRVPTVSCTAPFTGMLLDGASITTAESTFAAADAVTMPIKAKTKAIVMQVALFAFINARRLEQTNTTR